VSGPSTLPPRHRLPDPELWTSPEKMMDHLEPQLNTNRSSLILCPTSLKLWYAAYTCANHEKRVAEQLAERSVEHFLPLYESVRRWKDRQMRLKLPLFPGYVFVRFALRDRLRVLQIPSVANLVSFNGTPAVLPESEIEALKRSLEHGVQAVPHPYLKAGKRVRITAGPLEGLEGILIRKKKALRFVISLDLIQRSIMLEIDAASVEAVHARETS
jgi:transcription antitermination factor NusG